jgi:ferredoxin
MPKLFQDKYCLSVLVAIAVFGILAIIQVKLDPPMLLLERFFPGWGWLQAGLVALYGGFLAYQMKVPDKSAQWRVRSWGIFSGIFFGQLAIGLAGFENFLMTGKLHLPIPAMIIAGPVYRAEISFMTILFFSTVLLSGPAWCSHLCYFDALDALASKHGKTAPGTWSLKKYKLPIFIGIIGISLLFRWLGVNMYISTGAGMAFGAMGLGVILIISRKKGSMVHCTAFCPLGTLVHYLRYANPFKMRIHAGCTQCMKCSMACKYNALATKDIEKRKPGITCTLCGDCLSSCHEGAIQYKFLGLKTNHARNLYLFITISLHAVFLALARI